MKFLIDRQYQNGDCRIRQKFAWRPVRATNQDKVSVTTEYWVWLEWIDIYEEHRNGQWVQVYHHIKA